MSNTAVLQEQAPVQERQRPSATLVSSKITEEHWRLNAALYVRQSTSHQLREHQESTARQYGLKQRLIALGWSEEQVIVIDED